MGRLRRDRSDAELLQACGRDPKAFARFYDRYERPVVAFFMGRTGDAELAADLTAEVFARALGAAARYRAERSSAAPWLFTIAQNTLASSLRRGRVEADARRRLGIREPIRLDEDALERVETLEAHDGSLTALLDTLPEEQRRAIEARVIDERSYAEIAARLETSELVVRKRVSRGLARLREVSKGQT